MPAEFDVAILGAGPAGATAARWLATRGHQVCVLHRQSAARHHARWETLSPAALELLRFHHPDAWPGIADSLSPFRTTVLWTRSDERAQVRDGLGALSDRRIMDSLLRKSAAAAGVVFRPFDACSPPLVVRDPGGWSFAFQDSTGPPVRSRFLVEATGRASASAGACLAPGPRTLAVTARVSGTQLGQYQTLVESLLDGWLWAGRAGDAEALVTLFASPQTLRRWPRGGHSASFAALLESSSLIPPGNFACVVSPLTMRAATAIASMPVTSDGRWRTGDAVFAPDPLSGQGFHHALLTAAQAAIVLHTILVRAEATALARQFYQQSCEKTARDHEVTCKAFYARQDKFDGAFWSERAGGTPPHARHAAVHPVRLDLHETMVLSPQASWVETALIVGEFVVSRVALSHPSLKGPIAFLGDRPTSALLSCLSAGTSGYALIRRWSDSHGLSEEAGKRQLEDLIRHAIVVPARAKSSGTLA